MAVRDLRTLVAGTRTTGKWPTSGRFHVKFRDNKGYSLAATVLGPGTVSGLKLNIDSHSQTRIVDNVPAITARGQTGVYICRTS